MNSVFWTRLSTFLKETKISFGTLSLSYVLSVLFVVLFFIIRFAVSELRKERTKSDDKSNLQIGIEMFITDFLNPFINKQLTYESKEIKKHLTYCNLMRTNLLEINVRDENLKLKNIRLNMPKKYWAAAVHVIIEKMLAELLPSDSKDLDTEIIKQIQNIMAELYECGKNDETCLELYCDTGICRHIGSQIITGLFLTLGYYTVLISAMGATSLSVSLAVIGIACLLLFRKRINSIYISAGEMFMSIPYMIGFLILTKELQQFGVLPVLLVK